MTCKLEAQPKNESFQIEHQELIIKYSDILYNSDHAIANNPLHTEGIYQADSIFQCLFSHKQRQSLLLLQLSDSLTSRGIVRGTSDPDGSMSSCFSGSAAEAGILKTDHTSAVETKSTIALPADISTRGLLTLLPLHCASAYHIAALSETR